MIFTIYKITNTKNGKVYIGKSKDVDRRWTEHRRCPFRKGKSHNGCKKLYNSIRKHGIENFSFEKIAITENENVAYLAEDYYIRIHDSVKNGLNIMYGNRGASFSGSNHPNYGKGYLVMGANNPFFGKEHSRHSKNLMGKKRKGSKNPRAILTEDIVRSIKNNTELSVKELSKLHGVKGITIYKILQGNLWKHIT